jgi:hypothetical protein
MLCVRRAGATYGKLGGSTSPAHCERAVVAAAVRAGVGPGRIDDGIKADNRQTLGLAQGQGTLIILEKNDRVPSDGTGNGGVVGCHVDVRLAAVP